MLSIVEWHSLALVGKGPKDFGCVVAVFFPQHIQEADVLERRVASLAVERYDRMGRVTDK